MPTEAEYRIAATGINRYGDVAAAVGRSVADLIANPGLEGGRCAGPIGLSLDAMSADAVSLGTNLASLELELVRRANQCADYTAQIRQWQAEVATWKVDHQEFLRLRGEPGSRPEPPGRIPAMPIRPFPEAEAG